MSTLLCPLCHRPLGIEGIDAHHLIPKTFGGKDTEMVHKICHNTIHSKFTERELLHYYHTWDRIREHLDVQKFIEWVKNKPSNFYLPTKDSNERKSKRRR